MRGIGTFHLLFSFLALAFGAVVLTRWHRTWGQGYAWCMAGVIGTAFAMYNLPGRVTPFHVAALVAGVTLFGGMWTVLRRQPKKYWIDAHVRGMAWSYVGLTAALVAESLTR